VGLVRVCENFSEGRFTERRPAPFQHRFWLRHPETTFLLVVTTPTSNCEDRTGRRRSGASQADGRPGSAIFCAGATEGRRGTSAPLERWGVGQSGPYVPRTGTATPTFRRTAPRIVRPKLSLGRTTTTRRKRGATTRATTLHRPRGRGEVESVTTGESRCRQVRDRCDRREGADARPGGRQSNRAGLASHPCRRPTAGLAL